MNLKLALLITLTFNLSLVSNDHYNLVPFNREKAQQTPFRTLSEELEKIEETSPLNNPKRRKQHPEGQFSCEYCDKSCPSQSKLERHLVVHTKEKKFSCSQCGQRFTQQSSLKTHIEEKRCLNEEAPHSTTSSRRYLRYKWKCTFCQFGFESLDKLNLHNQSKLHKRNVERMLPAAAISVPELLALDQSTTDVPLKMTSLDLLCNAATMIENE